MATRTLADIWSSQLSVEERLCIFLERYRQETPTPPTSPRAMGYRDALENVAYYCLDRHPLPPESFK